MRTTTYDQRTVSKTKLAFYILGLLVISTVLGYSMGYWPAKSKKTESTTKFSYYCLSGKNALELLQSAHRIEFDQSSFGKLVTSINGIKQGNGKYWLYSVDNKEATVGAESYICQDQEQISWELK